MTSSTPDLEHYDEHTWSVEGWPYLVELFGESGQEYQLLVSIDRSCPYCASDFELLDQRDSGLFYDTATEKEIGALLFSVLKEFVDGNQSV